MISTLASEYSLTGIEPLFRTFLFFVIIYLFYTLLEDYNDIKLYIAAFFITAAILLILSVYYFYLADFNIINFSQSLELKGEESYIHKNGIGAFFLITISILTAYYLINKNTKNKVSIFLIICILIFGLIITNSRGAIFSLFFGIILIFYTVNKKFLLKFLLFLILLIPFLFIDPISNFIEIYLKLDALASGRDYILETTYNVIIQNPIFGAGPAATKFEIYKYLPFMLGSPEELIFFSHFNILQYGHAHNFYLFFFSDLGIPGFILSITLPVIFLTIGFRVMKEFKKEANHFYFLVVGIQAAGLALFIRGIFEWGGIISYGALSADLPFWWIFCILIFLYQNRKKIV